MRLRPNVFAIPAGTPFLDTCVAAFVSGALFGRSQPLTPEEIAASRLFVPTRRAGQALTAALAAQSGAGATLLPTIVPLGDQDALDEALGGFGGETLADLPAIGELDRRLALFPMVDAWRSAIAADRDEEGAREPFFVARSRADAFALAGDLAALIDEAILEDVPLARLAMGVPVDYRPEAHSQYWSMTERLLAIAARHYPAMVAERGMTERYARFVRKLRVAIGQLQQDAPATPLVVVGSTGSVAATAESMAVVARLPMGAVVLPGLDLILPQDIWGRIGAEDADLPTRFAHPQALLKRSLARIEIAHEDVVRLPAGGGVTPRERLISGLFWPAEATARWQDAALPQHALDAAVAGIMLLEAADEREEALAVAVLLREVLETPGRTAALVTPDRSLARAVQAELERWNVAIADSAGEPLDATAAATLARLALAASQPDAAGVDVLAVLRHPLTRLGLDDAVRAACLDCIEIAGLRGRRLKGGAAGLCAALAAARTEDLRRAPAPRKRIDDAVFEPAMAHAARFAAAISAFRCGTDGAPTLRACAAAHRMLVETLLTPSPDEPGILAGDDGLALGQVFDDIATAHEDGPVLDPGDYAAIFEEMLAGRVVRPRQPGHPRLKIWGLLEARLLEADRIILSGLDEGVWPPDARSDAFLNRPMRIALGLQPPERRIGQTAHDFLMLLGAPDVVLTRARKRGGSPVIASRFLRRLTAFAGRPATEAMQARAAQVLDWARRLDQPAAVRACPPPAPRPPADLTPEALSLTEIETLYRDPYTIFARRILRLDPLPLLDPPLDARDRGNVVHEALSRFTKEHARHLPEDAASALLTFGEAAFAEVRQEAPETVEFWWRRFQAFVPWFIAWDSARRLNVRHLHSEIPGAWMLALPGGRSLRLSTRADRIEESVGGGIAIIDYKTGTPPGEKEVLRGLAPQLPLTAALAARGAFPALGTVDIAAGAALSYLHVARSGGDGEEKAVKAKLQPLEEVIEHQFAQLQAYLGHFVTGVQGYQSHRIPKKRNYRSDYDHLARHLEWSLGGDGAGEGEA